MTSYDPSRSASSAMMRNISRVSSEIAKSCSPQSDSEPPYALPGGAAAVPFRRYRSDVPLDGFVTPPRAYPARRAPWQTASPLVNSNRQLDPENRSQCSETSIPDNPLSPDESDTSIADYVVASEANYVGDEMQQSNERACKSQSQLESDAESKQKQINRVFMNLKIAEKVNFNYEWMLELKNVGLTLWACMAIVFHTAMTSSLA